MDDDTFFFCVFVFACPFKLCCRVTPGQTLVCCHYIHQTKYKFMTKTNKCSLLSHHFHAVGRFHALYSLVSVLFMH